MAQAATTASASAPARQPGAHVVLVGDEPVLYLERGGKGLQVLVAPSDEARVDRAIEALVEHVRHGRAGRLALERVDGEPVVGSAWEDRLVEAGFRAGTTQARAVRVARPYPRIGA